MDACQIIITRESSPIGCALSHTVELDGIAVGVLKNGGTLTAFTSPGPHAITFLYHGKIRGSISVLIEPEHPVLKLSAELYGNQNVRVVKEATAGQGGNHFVPGETMECKTCGTEITKGANRCPHCGAVARSRSKITECKSCGNDVAKTANICPHCGAKRRQGTQAACWILAVLFISFGVCYILFGGSNSDAPKQDTAGQDKTAPVSAIPPTPTSSPSAESFQSLTFGPGTYTVGKDIDAGTYDCIAVEGFGVLRGEVASHGATGFVQTMGTASASIGGVSASVESAESYSNLELADGDVIYIEMNLKVQFVPK